MTRFEAEQQKTAHINLKNKILLHIKAGVPMQVTDVSIDEKQPNDFYVFCKLKGASAEINEPLNNVLSNYTAIQFAVH